MPHRSAYNVKLQFSDDSIAQLLQSFDFPESLRRAIICVDRPFATDGTARHRLCEINQLRIHLSGDLILSLVTLQQSLSHPFYALIKSIISRGATLPVGYCYAAGGGGGAAGGGGGGD